MIDVTEVKIVLMNEDKLKAYVSITINNCFVIRDLKVIEGPGGLFVAMPSKKRKDGQYRDIAHPLDQDTRSQLENALLNAYEAELKNNAHKHGGHHTNQIS